MIRILLARDKQLHFFVGLVISIVFSYFLTPYFGIAAAIAAGIGKEVYDLTGRGCACHIDAIVTFVGCFAGVMLVVLLQQVRIP